MTLDGKLIEIFHAMYVATSWAVEEGIVMGIQFLSSTASAQADEPLRIGVDPIRSTVGTVLQCVQENLEIVRSSNGLELQVPPISHF